MAASKVNREPVAEYKRRLLEDVGLKPGEKVYVILRHVSASGMYRIIEPVVVRDGSIQNIGFNVAGLLGYKYDRDRGGVAMSGCGMDMGFALVYDLSSALFPEGFGCIGDGGSPETVGIRGHGCPSNDHSNGDRDYTPHHAPVSADAQGCTLFARHWHRDGGYALRKEWI